MPRRRPTRRWRAASGPLCGIPLTIKDSHWLAGTTSATGSRALADFVPGATSAAVERLEDAGAVIYAKTTTPEFCYFGVTESPLNGRTTTPGIPPDAGRLVRGRAAALAAGAGPLALGGDGGGSIRIPSAFCGVVGFKPTFGLVAREPCSPAGSRWSATGRWRATWPMPARCCSRSPGCTRATVTASTSTA